MAAISASLPLLEIGIIFNVVGVKGQRTAATMLGACFAAPALGLADRTFDLCLLRSQVEEPKHYPNKEKQPNRTVEQFFFGRGARAVLELGSTDGKAP